MMFMKPTSESLSLEATRYFNVAEGYCVPARVGGEQPEANDQPQTRVNPIRLARMTSRRSGGICVPEPSGAGVPCEVLGIFPGVFLAREHSTTRYNGATGCWRVGGVRMVGRLHKLSQEHCPFRRGTGTCQSPHSSDEASNDRGAKEGRKVNPL